MKAWIAAQNQFARAYLDAIPQRPAIAGRVVRVAAGARVRRYAFELRGQLFALKNAPPNNQAQLVVMPRNGDVAKERVVVDPLRIDPKGGTAIDFYRASYDGKHVVVSLSENGSEDGTAYVYEVATGKRLPDSRAGRKFPDRRRQLRMGARRQRLLLHALSARRRAPGRRPPLLPDSLVPHAGHAAWRRPLRDRARLSADCGNSLLGSRNGQYLLAAVGNGDGGEIAFHLRDSAGQWTRVADFSDGVKRMEFGEDGRLYATSIKDAPLGRVIAIPLAEPSLAKAR